MDRRGFIQSTTAAGLGSVVAGSAVAGAFDQPELSRRAPDANAPRPLFVATWKFGLRACQTAVEVGAAADGSMLDAVEAGIGLIEADENNATVGIGGTPNAIGQVELDACVMAGPGHRAGSVAGLQDIAHPIAVARRVMDQTRHVMLVGENAKRFALEQGFPETDLVTAAARERWEKWKSEKGNTRDGKPVPQGPVHDQNHDTIAMVGLDSGGDLYGGCSTSGAGFKMPGRVGDSPILGSGLYVDNQVGAAGATGIGENVMRFCGSFLVVEFMRMGLSPESACRAAIERIASLDPSGYEGLEINFIALNRQGEFGAAGTSRGFQFAFASPEGGDVRDAALVRPDLVEKK